MSSNRQPQQRIAPRFAKPISRGGTVTKISASEDQSLHDPKKSPLEFIKQAWSVNVVGITCVAVALVIGFYHGWLKRTFPGALAVFAYDIPLVVGLVVALRSVRDRHPIFPNSPTAIALKFVLGICIFFLLIPTDVPWIIRIASFRGWVFTPLMFLVGYHLLKTPQQLRVLGWLIILLSLLTTFYGMRQTQADVLTGVNMDDEAVMRTINGSTYGREDGTGGFRVFSTFVGGGMFAFALAFGVIIAVVEVTGPKLSWVKRLFFIGSILICLNGIFISGTRSALINCIIGSVVVLWLRGSIVRVAPVVTVLGVIAVTVSSIYGGIDTSRMAKAFSFDEVYWRIYIVVQPAVTALLENPLGRGIGYSTHGIPVMLSYLVSKYKPFQIDGDIGQAAVDFGIVGMVAYVVMIVRGAWDSLTWARVLKGTNGEIIAIICSAMFFVALPAFVTGSPFLHVPVGAIVWCFFGGLNRIRDDFVGDFNENPRRFRHPVEAFELARQRGQTGDRIGEASSDTRLKGHPKAFSPKRFLFK